jgi:hypothetical protein
MKEELAEIIRTFEAVGPLVGNAVKSGQLFNPQAELTEPDPDLLCEYDVEIPMSEGFSLTANIFRSKKATEKSEKVPSVPYRNDASCNHGNYVLHFGGEYDSYLLIP